MLMQYIALQARDSARAAASSSGSTVSSPHSVWTSFTDATTSAAAPDDGLGRLAAAAGAAADLASSGDVSADSSGTGRAAAQAAESTKEMAQAAHGVISEASRLANDIIAAGACPCLIRLLKDSALQPSACMFLASRPLTAG